MTLNILISSLNIVILIKCDIVSLTHFHIITVHNVMDTPVVSKFSKILNIC